ncbi:secreted RxLR effector peptide protein, putative [Phytophthora infestans T30-4]|uniref:RxLR effector protein n=1 Tax=Phytophthora infestans (strain T30-4) TaxID=403677 RepID=D0N131_PHYIT|nr:secreted RxLR effector peptide protein, putative [Phytophthora infestans T30-4]EEY67344.1 secreted RxLR effector peptide protein, putative [Phytophthora infestans T30-4]|eukprot:XP_002905992.1 secreted RxLR effector peptide protein, putative [Phytophthora infestans T30-4]
MRLSPIHLVVAATIVATGCAASAATDSDGPQLSPETSPDAVVLADTIPQKSARLLRSRDAQEEERVHPLLMHEGVAVAIAKSVSADLDSRLMAKVSQIDNGKEILKQWRDKGLTIAKLKPLLKNTKKWKATPERAVYNLLKKERFS